jgi:hypothetical protein
MHECFETLKGEHVEVALTNQTLHGVLDDVVANDPIFLVLEAEDHQKILINIQHVITVRAVTSFDKGWDRGAYY